MSNTGDTPDYIYTDEVTNIDVTNWNKLICDDIFDGCISTYGPTTSDEIAWVQKKMEEEQALEKLAEDNEAVNIALRQFKEAEQKLRITAHLARKHD